MGNEIKYRAHVIVQDGILQNELGKRYLIQVDTNEGRFFIDATPFVFRILDKSMPNAGEFYLDEKKDD